jgi:hypothetical protein
MLRPLTVLAMIATMVIGASVRADDDDKADDLRAQAKKLLAQAREFKQAGQVDRAEKAAREAKELLAAANKLDPEDDDDDKKPKAANTEKEPRKEKTPKPEGDPVKKPVKEEPRKVEKHEGEPVKKPVKEEPRKVEKHEGEPVKKPLTKEIEFRVIEKREGEPVKKPQPGGEPHGLKFEIVPGKVPGEPGAAPKVLFLAMKSPEGGQPNIEAKMRHMAEAAKHLREAGMGEMAEHLERQIGQMKEHLMRMQQERGGPGAGGPGADLHRALQELRAEVNALRQQVREMRAEMGKRN